MSPGASCHWRERRYGPLQRRHPGCRQPEPTGLPVVEDSAPRWCADELPGTSVLNLWGAPPRAPRGHCTRRPEEACPVYVLWTHAPTQAWGKHGGAGTDPGNRGLPPPVGVPPGGTRAGGAAQGVAPAHGPRRLSRQRACPIRRRYPRHPDPWPVSSRPAHATRSSHRGTTRWLRPSPGRRRRDRPPAPPAGTAHPPAAAAR